MARRWRWILRRFERYELGLLLAALAAIACVWFFIELTDEVIEGETRAFDRWALTILRDRQGEPIGPAWLEDAALDLSALGGGTVLTAFVLIVIGFLIFCRYWATTTLVLAATLGGWIINTALKLLIDRPRPTVVEPLTEAALPSFPSGHSMLSMVLYPTFAVILLRLVRRWRLKAYIAFVAAALVFLIGLTRVYLGVHYPTDVLAGWSAGLAWAILCYLALLLLQHRGIVRPRTTSDSSEETASHPPRSGGGDDETSP